MGRISRLNSIGFAPPLSRDAAKPAWAEVNNVKTSSWRKHMSLNQFCIMADQYQHSPLRGITTLDDSRTDLIYIQVDSGLLRISSLRPLWRVGSLLATIWRERTGRTSPVAQER